MNGTTIIITCVIVGIVTSFMTNNARNHPAAAVTQDGMRVLQNKRLGLVALLLMVVMGGMILGLGVLCFLDIGFGQGGVVMLFMALGVGMILLGFFFRHLNDRNRVCFDEERVIRYKAIGAPVEILWAEVTTYNCDPRRTFLAAMDGRKITVDYTYSGLGEFVEMIQRKVASRTAPAGTPYTPPVGMDQGAGR